MQFKVQSQQQDHMRQSTKTVHGGGPNKTKET